MDNEPADGLLYIEGSLLYLAATVGEPDATDLSEAQPEAAGWPGRSYHIAPLRTPRIEKDDGFSITPLD
jgi:hypothetical protein